MTFITFFFVSLCELFVGEFAPGAPWLWWCASLLPRVNGFLTISLIDSPCTELEPINLLHGEISPIMDFMASRLRPEYHTPLYRSGRCNAPIACYMLRLDSAYVHIRHEAT
jgi:hypothetical protein